MILARTARNNFSSISQCWYLWSKKSKM